MGRLTIGRKYSGRTREYTADCDICGVRWHRADLTLMPDMTLACPDDASGRTALEIDRQRAIDASEPSFIGGKRLEGP